MTVYIFIHIGYRYMLPLRIDAISNKLKQYIKLCLCIVQGTYTHIFI